MDQEWKSIRISTYSSKQGLFRVMFLPWFQVAFVWEDQLSHQEDSLRKILQVVDYFDLAVKLALKINAESLCICGTQLAVVPRFPGSSNILHQLLVFPFSIKQKG